MNVSSRSAPFHRGDYVKITLFGFAFTALWQSLHSIILPVRLLDFVPEAQKNTYLGLMTLAGLLLANFVELPKYLQDDIINRTSLAV